MPFSAHRRGINADVKYARTGASRRLRIRIATEVANRPVAPDNPYDAKVEPPDPGTDKIVPASGSFSETKVADVFDSIGKQVERRGILEMHPMFEASMRQAYAVEIGLEPGRWKVTGVRTDTVRCVLIVYVQGMD